jgi:hypothetical protein
MYHSTIFCLSELQQHTLLPWNYHSTLYWFLELPHHTLPSVRITTTLPTAHWNYHSTLYCPLELPQNTTLNWNYHSTLYCPLQLLQHTTLNWNYHSTPYCPLELPQRTTVRITTAHSAVFQNCCCTLYCLSELPHYTLLSIIITTAHSTFLRSYHSTLYCLSELPQHTVISIRITTAHFNFHQNYQSTLRVPSLLLSKTVTHCDRLPRCLNACKLSMQLAAHHVCQLASFCVSATLVLFHLHCMFSCCLVGLKSLPQKLFGEKRLKTPLPLFSMFIMFGSPQIPLKFTSLLAKCIFLSCMVSRNSPRI